MLNAKAFANAVTIVTVVFYIVCLVLSNIAPDLILSIGQAWVHTINLESLTVASSLSLDKVVLGIVSIGLLTWVTTYATIWLYNKLAKKG